MRVAFFGGKTVSSWYALAFDREMLVAARVARGRPTSSTNISAPTMPKPAVLIIVENLPVPLDRRVWQESCALRDAGYEVVVISPQMRGYTQEEEKAEGIQIYRHWI